MENSKSRFVTKSDVYLLVIFIMMAIAIVAKSYFDPDGFVSRDGSNYLRLAQNLLNGNGYYWPVFDATGQAGQEHVPFAIWPIGYPTLIYITSALTGLSVFWASKLFNIFLVLIILITFRAYFSNAWLFGLILFFSEFLDVFAASTSESLFLASLLVFSVSLSSFVSSKNKVFVAACVVTVSSLMLFLSRYVGAFSFGIIGLFGLYCLFIRRELSKAVVLIVIATFNIVFMAAYLYFNYLETGFPTGIQRISAPESVGQLAIMYVNAFIAETVVVTTYIGTKTYLFAVAQFFLVAIIAWKWRKNIFENVGSKARLDTMLINTFAFVAAVYVLAILLLRSLTHFDDIDYRFLAPGSFIIFVLLIYYLQGRVVSHQPKKLMAYALVILSVGSFVLNVPLNILGSSAPGSNYQDTIDALHVKYKEVDSDAVVVFGSIHVNYLYPSIQNRRPYMRPYNVEKETWDEFKERLLMGNNKRVYLDVPLNDLDVERVGQTIIHRLSEFEKGSLVELVL